MPCWRKGWSDPEVWGCFAAQSPASQLLQVPRRPRGQCCPCGTGNATAAGSVLSLWDRYRYGRRVSAVPAGQVPLRPQGQCCPCGTDTATASGSVLSLWDRYRDGPGSALSLWDRYRDGPGSALSLWDRHHDGLRLSAVPVGAGLPAIGARSGPDVFQASLTISMISII